MTRLFYCLGLAGLALTGNDASAQVAAQNINKTAPPRRSSSQDLSVHRKRFASSSKSSSSSNGSSSSASEERLRFYQPILPKPGSEHVAHAVVDEDERESGDEEELLDLYRDNFMDLHAVLDSLEETFLKGQQLGNLPITSNEGLAKDSSAKSHPRAHSRLFNAAIEPRDYLRIPDIDPILSSSANPLNYADEMEEEELSSFAKRKRSNGSKDFGYLTNEYAPLEPIAGLPL